MLPLVELVQWLLPILELVVVRALLPGILVELVQPMLLPTLSPALRCPLRLTDPAQRIHFRKPERSTTEPFFQKTRNNRERERMSRAARPATRKEGECGALEDDGMDGVK
jgi:hypothetical protein